MSPKYVKFVIEIAVYSVFVGVLVTYYDGMARGFEASLLAAGLIAFTKTIYFFTGAALGSLGVKQFTEQADELKSFVEAENK
jgi:hypothetical protein